MVRHGYSLMRGGLVHRLLDATGATRRSRHLSWWLALALLAVALLPLLPLLLLCAGSGWLLPRASGMPLSSDYASLARLLLALPLLVVAAPRADALLHNAFRQLSQPAVVPERRLPRLEALLASVRRTRPDDSLLDHGDPSALADFNAVYQGVARMAIVPVDRWVLLWIALHAALPLCPLVLLATSVDELVAKLFGILL